MAFVWVILYGLSYAVSRFAESVLHAPPAAAAAVMPLYLCLLLLWIVRSGRCYALALHPPGRLGFAGVAYCLPLAMLPLCNLLKAGGGTFDFASIPLLLSAAAVEEIFFRGFLLRHLERYGRALALLASSALFAAFHAVNFIHGGDGTYAVLQLLCALGAGMCYGAAAFRLDSLLPCMVAHVLTNLTALASPDHLAGGWPALLMWICAAAQLLIGTWLCFQNRR